MADPAQAPAELVHHANARFAHLYALLRHDGFQPTDAKPHVTVTVTKVFADQTQPQQEAERLNVLARQRGIDATYWVQVTRFVPLSSPTHDRLNGPSLVHSPDHCFSSHSAIHGGAFWIGCAVTCRSSTLQSADCSASRIA